MSIPIIPFDEGEALLDWVELTQALADGHKLPKAEIGDTHGNLTYRRAARNFSPLMCAAAQTTIVQAGTIVDPGGIDPEHVVTPGRFVDRLVEVANPQQEEALIRAGATYP